MAPKGSSGVQPVEEGSGFQPMERGWDFQPVALKGSSGVQPVEEGFQPEAKREIFELSRPSTITRLTHGGRLGAPTKFYPASQPSGQFTSQPARQLKSQTRKQPGRRHQRNHVNLNFMFFIGLLLTFSHFEGLYCCLKILLCF